MVRNANKLHKESLGINERIGLFITKTVGTMWCAYAFALLALVSLPAALASGQLIIIVAWIAQTFLQLVLLSIIMVGQDLQSRHSEIRAELDFETNTKAEKEIEKILNKLDKQDKQILKIVEKL